MNPVLLKPESDVGAQVIVQGKRFATLKARDYAKAKPELLSKTLESFHRLAKSADLIVIEGAGSPAEINLRKGDIANMGFAEAADVPVILVGDIDRGGVIAQIVGTHCVLPSNDRSLIKAFIINKFRGDVTLFDEGISEISTRTEWAPLGVLPWFADAWQLPAEDVMDIASTTRSGDVIKIAVPKLSRIANFDDLDPLAMEPGVSVEIIEPGHPLPADADLVLIPGSKSTIGDLAFFRAQGWDIDLLGHAQRGGQVLGICGGYQMLGHTISDPDGIEGEKGSVPGLGLLNVETTMAPMKRLADVEGVHLPSHAAVNGYEIHIGSTDGVDAGRPWLQIDGKLTGAASQNGKIEGCYIHGLFTSDEFRRVYLNKLGGKSLVNNYGASVELALDALADHLEQHLDIDSLFGMAQEVSVG
jgi:adenosylcobyric acid synthase